MKVYSAARAIWYRDLGPGSLFVHPLDDGQLALGLRLAKNQFDMGSVAFTHAPRNGSLPGLLTSRLIEDDATVLEYEEAAIHPAQDLKNLQQGGLPTGAIVARVGGLFLVCERDGNTYLVNVATGEVSGVGHVPGYWTSHWRIEDRFENVLFEHGGS